MTQEFVGMETARPSKDFILLDDLVTRAESEFPIKPLLKSHYFGLSREEFYESKKAGLFNPYRNYLTLLTYLHEIHRYNTQHAMSFAKQLRENSASPAQCDAVFAEIIVYRHYVPCVYERLIRRIDLNKREADVIVERSDGSTMFMEVFSVNPKTNMRKDSEGTIDIKTHTQDAMSSIRHKLLRKIKKQKQMSQDRENYAVIELNCASIAGDFSVLSSLSSGYEVQIDMNTMRRVSEGYNWRTSIFDDPATKFLKGIIYFNLGNYSSRRCLRNPGYSATDNALV